MKEVFILVGDDNGEVLSVHDEQQPFELEDGWPVMQFKIPEKMTFHASDFIGKQEIISRTRESERSKHEFNTIDNCSKEENGLCNLWKEDHFDWLCSNSPLQQDLRNSRGLVRL